MPEILARKRLRQEDDEAKVNSGYGKSIPK